MNDNQNNSTNYSQVDRLASKAESMFGRASDGGNVLTLIVLLSGVLSALFFWQNAGAVFANVWPPAAITLALAVGLLPNEGAFFGWKRIRTAKHDLTEDQLKATKWGLVSAVAGSIFGTFALFVISFPYVPAEILAYKEWFVFIALGVPIMIQVGISAYYSINERRTVENHEQAKLAAIGFDAYIRSEMARIAAIIEGQEMALDAKLKDYGAAVGANNADNMLSNGSRELLGMGNRPQIPAVASQTQQPNTQPAPQQPEARPSAPRPFGLEESDPRPLSSNTPEFPYR